MLQKMRYRITFETLIVRTEEGIKKKNQTNFNFQVPRLLYVTTVSCVLQNLDLFSALTAFKQEKNIIGSYSIFGYTGLILRTDPFNRLLCINKSLECQSTATLFIL